MLTSTSRASGALTSGRHEFSDRAHRGTDRSLVAMWIFAGVLAVAAGEATAQDGWLFDDQAVGRNEEIVSSSGGSVGLQGFAADPLLNDDGTLLLHVHWMLAPGPQERIYRADALGLQTEVARTEPYLGDPNRFEDLGSIRLNHRGEAAFLATYTAGRTTAQYNPAGTTLQEVASDGVGGFDSIDGLALAGNGVLAVVGPERPTFLLPPKDSVLLSDPAGAGSQVFADGLGDVTINRFGRAAWRRQTDGNVPNDRIEVADSSGLIGALIDGNTVEPGTDGYLETIADPVINDSGTIAFRATAIDLDANQNPVHPIAGVFAVEPNGHARVVQVATGFGVPGTGGGQVINQVEAFSAPDINNRGDVLYAVNVSGSSLGELNDSALLRHDAEQSPQGFVPLLAENERTPRGDRRFGEIGGAHLTEFTAAALLVPLRDENENPAGVGIYLIGDTDRLTVAETGDLDGSWETFDLSMVQGQDTGGRAAVNRHGQVAYLARERNTITDELRQAVRLFTPDLQWRKEADGRWDDVDNWTLSIAPAAVHDVGIHTLGGLTVEGPESDTTVRSLHLSGVLGARPVLELKHDVDVNVAGQLRVEARGKIDHTRGRLTAATFVNDGEYLQTGRAVLVAGGLLNEDRMQIEHVAAFGPEAPGLADVTEGAPAVTAEFGQAINEGELIVADNAELYVPVLEAGFGGLVNRGAFVLLGGRVVGAVANDFAAEADMEGDVTGDLGNFGELTVTGLLSVAGTFTNYGRTEVAERNALRTGLSLTGFDGDGPPGDWENHGELLLSGGQVAPPVALVNEHGGRIEGYGTVGALTFFSETANEGGVIHASVAGQWLTFTSLASNVDGGRILIEAGAAVRSLASPISSEIEGLNNTGEIALLGDGAEFVGEELVNRGTIRGRGRLAVDVTNHGVIRAEGGELAVTGEFDLNGPYEGTLPLTAGVGRIVVEQDAALLALQGLETNTGHVALAGGTFDNNAKNMTNAPGGVIGGWGTLRAATVSNAGLIDLADANSDVFANLVNTGRVEIDNAVTTVFGNVTNAASGSITVNNGTLRVFGTLVNDGALVTDPTVVEVSEFVNGASGYVVADPGDRFVIHGDLQSESTEKLKWQTGSAVLAFVGGATHTLSLTGDDLGATVAGLSDNFAWGTLELGAGESLVLRESNGGQPGDAALYVSRLSLGGGLEQIARIESAGLNIYYDPDVPTNAYLGGSVYGLSGGGLLQPVPEPASLALLALGAVLLPKRRRP